MEMLERNSKAFSLNEFDLGRCNLVKYHMDTGDAAPIRQVHNRVPYSFRDEVKQHLDKMLEKGIIRPSTSPWASPVVLPPKSDGTRRFCVDFRRVNEVTVKDAHPLPRIDEILDHLRDAKVITAMDLASGFWQIEATPETQPKTAFASYFGLYEFTVMPFGVTGGPAVFQRLVDCLLAGLRYETCMVYIDDIVVFAKTPEEHERRLEQVLQRISDANLKLKPSKCKFAQLEVKLLGHIISGEGIKPDPEKRAQIEQLEEPTTPTGVRAFLGLAGYYRRFIKDFATLAIPLNGLLKKGKEWEWTPKCQEAFEKLRSALHSQPILKHPDFTKPYILQTDASDIGLGAVLTQLGDDGKEYAIAYASRSLIPAERNYTTHEKELLAVVFGIKYFHVHLYGQENFEVVTDHAALKWLHSTQTDNQRVNRWKVFLQAYNLQIRHRPGLKNGNADALSRLDKPALEKEGLVATGEEPWDFPLVLLAQKELPEIPEVQKYGDLQKADPYLNALRKYLTDKHLPDDSARATRIAAEAPNYCLYEGVLYRTIRVRRGSYHFVLTVPKAHIQCVLQQMHDNAVTGAHLSFNKTLSRAMSTFYWPNMAVDIKTYCEKCEQCAKRKAPTPRPKYPLQPITVGAPFERVGMDVVGPLPQTQLGNKWILVFTEYLTKWPEAVAIPNQEAATVASAFVSEIISRHGCPQKLLSDRGPNFMGSVMQEVMRLLGVTHTPSTAYHPQTDGLTERFNATLASMLSNYVNTYQNNWDEYLPYVLFAYRSSIHASIGDTPFYLLYGRNCLLPTPQAYDPPTGYFHDIDDYKLVMQAAFKEAWQSAKENIQKAQESYRHYYNKKLRVIDYRVGDLVWLESPPKMVAGGRKKLAEKYTGPWRILSITSVNAVIESLVKSHRQGGKKVPVTDVVHLNRLKPHKGDFAIKPLAGWTTDEESEDESPSPTRPSSPEKPQSAPAVVTEKSESSDTSGGEGSHEF
jgi:hypothetical protein